MRGDNFLAPDPGLLRIHGARTLPKRKSEGRYRDLPRLKSQLITDPRNLSCGHFQGLLFVVFYANLWSLKTDHQFPTSLLARVLELRTQIIRIPSILDWNFKSDFFSKKIVREACSFKDSTPTGYETRPPQLVQ